MKTIKNISMLLVFLAAAIACNQEKPQDTTSETMEPAAPMAMNFPYEIDYSSSWEIGNPAYAEMVVQGSWKDWEDNNIDNMANWVIDTIWVAHSNNQIVQGRDTLIARWKTARAKIKETNIQINAVLPMYSTDRKEHWVCVWATSIDTSTEGVTDTTALMETWRINSEGKADMLLQFDRANRKK